MDAQKAIAGLGATIGGAAATATKLGSKFSESGKDTLPSRDDLKMAKRARQTALKKINAIIENREISAKARTRRVGKVIDEYKGD